MATINFGVSVTNGGRVGDTTDDWFQAQKFTAPANGNITSVSVTYRANVGSPVDTNVMNFQTDSAGSPSQTNLTTDTYSVTPSASNTVNLGTPLSIVLGSVYWVLFHRSGSADPSNYLSIANDSGVATTPSINFSNAYVLTTTNPGELVMTITYTPTGGVTLATRKTLLGVGI